MPMNTKQVMRMMLEEMSSWTPDNSREYRCSGICKRLEVKLESQSLPSEPAEHIAAYTLKKIFKDWPKYSGYISYPISTSDDLSPKTGFCYCDHLWISEPTDPSWMQEYVALRWELVAFCIEWLKHELSIERIFDHENF